MEAGALKAEARGVAYVLTVFTAGVNELLLLDFIETVGKAPRQGLTSRRRPGLRGPNHSTSVMAFGAKESENQGRRCRCSAAGTHRALLTGGVRPEGPRRGGQSPPRAPGAPPRRQPGMRAVSHFPSPSKTRRCGADTPGLRGRRCRRLTPRGSRGAPSSPPAAPRPAEPHPRGAQTAARPRPGTAPHSPPHRFPSSRGGCCGGPEPSWALPHARRPAGHGLMPGRGSEGAAPLPPVPTRLRCGGKREGKSGAAARAPVAGPERFSLSGAFFLRHQLLPGGGGGGPAWARAGAGPGPARSAPPRPGTGRTRGGGRTRARDSAGRGWRGRTGRRELRAQGSAVRGRQRGGRRQWRRLLALPAAAAQPRLAGPRGQDGGAGSAFRTRPSAAAVRPPERGGDAPPVCPPGAAAPGPPPPRCVGVRGGGEGRTRAVGHTQTHARTASGARARAGPASRRLGARALSIVARAAPPGARRGPDGDVRAVTMVTSARPPPAALGPGRAGSGTGARGLAAPAAPALRARRAELAPRSGTPALSESWTELLFLLAGSPGRRAQLRAWQSSGTRRSGLMGGSQGVLRRACSWSP